MTSAPDRRNIIALIDAAMAAGARRSAACAEFGLHARTLQCVFRVIVGTDFRG